MCHTKGDTLTHFGESMSQIIYNVTTAVTEGIRDEWLRWMEDSHIPRMLQTGLFTSARLLRVHAFERDALTYCAQYIAESREDFERFRAEFAFDIESKHTSHFGEDATCFSTVLEVIEAFERTTH